MSCRRGRRRRQSTWCAVAELFFGDAPVPRALAMATCPFRRKLGRRGRLLGQPFIRRAVSMMLAARRSVGVDRASAPGLLLQTVMVLGLSRWIRTPSSGAHADDRLVVDLAARYGKTVVGPHRVRVAERRPAHRQARAAAGSSGSRIETLSQVDDVFRASRHSVAIRAPRLSPSGSARARDRSRVASSRNRRFRRISPGPGAAGTSACSCIWIVIPTSAPTPRSSPGMAERSQGPPTTAPRHTTRRHRGGTARRSSRRRSRRCRRTTRNERSATTLEP